MKLWRYTEATTGWVLAGIIGKDNTASELWALDITSDARYLAVSAYDGRVHLWDIQNGKGDQWEKVREYETKGSFGMCVAMVRGLSLDSHLGTKIVNIEPGWKVYGVGTREWKCPRLQ